MLHEIRNTQSCPERKKACPELSRRAEGTEDSKIRAKSTPKLRFSPPTNLFYNCRESSTNQPLFMQNKPNFQNGKMNIALYPETNYERKGLYSCRKNKAKQTQFKLEAQRRSLRVSFLESSNQGANLAKMGHYE